MKNDCSVCVYSQVIVTTSFASDVGKYTAINVPMAMSHYGLIWSYGYFISYLQALKRQRGVKHLMAVKEKQSMSPDSTLGRSHQRICWHLTCHDCEWRRSQLTCAECNPNTLLTSGIKNRMWNTSLQQYTCCWIDKRQMDNRFNRHFLRYSNFPLNSLKY